MAATRLPVNWKRLWITEMAINYHNEQKKPDKNEKLIGEGVGFERIRRITGYLVGTLDRFNNAKRAEERDRVKHSAGGCHCD